MTTHLGQDRSTADDASRSSRRDPIALVLVAIALAAALTILQRSFDHRSLIDLEVYRKGAWAFDHGRNPFGSGLPGPKLPFTYTPFSTIVFAPLALLTLGADVVIHTFASVAALVVTIFVLVRRLDDHKHPLSVQLAMAAALSVIAFFSEPVLQTLGFGQINLILMMFVVLDLLAPPSRRWAGVLLGIAAGIKLTPLVFVPYLLLTRRYRTAANASLAALGTVIVGWAFMPGPSHTYFFHLMFDARRVGNVEYVGNQSLDGMWTRIEHGVTAAHPFWAVSAVIVLAVGLWTASQIHRRFGEPSGMATCAITGLLVSPISWSHHWVWWIVVAMVLAHHAWVRRSALLAAGAVAWSIPFFVAPFWFVPHKHHRTYPHGWGQQVMASAYVLLGLVALAVTASLVAWHGRSERRGTPEVEPERALQASR